MKQDDSEIFAIDDDAFLNGGDDDFASSTAAPVSTPTPTPTPTPAPTATTTSATDDFSTDSSFAEPAQEVVEAPRPTPTIGRFSTSTGPSTNLIGVPYEPEKPAENVTPEPAEVPAKPVEVPEEPVKPVETSEQPVKPAETPEEAPAPVIDTAPEEVTPVVEEPAVKIEDAPEVTDKEIVEPVVETTEPKVENEQADQPKTDEPKVTAVEAEKPTEEPVDDNKSNQEEIPLTAEVPMMQVKTHSKDDNPFLKDNAFHKIDDDEKTEAPKISAFETTGGSFVETPVEPQVPDKVRPYPGIPEHEDTDNTPRSFVLTPSQTMAEEYEKKSLEEKTKESNGKDDGPQMPSQEMADSFVGTPIDVSALAKAMHHENESEEADSPKPDEEPAVLGPVISSAGMASLTEINTYSPSQSTTSTTETPAEKPAATAEEPKADEVKAEGKPAEEKPVAKAEKPAEEKPATEVEKPAEEKPETELETSTDKPAEEKPAAEAEKPAEEKPATEVEKPAEEKPEEIKSESTDEKPEGEISTYPSNGDANATPELAPELGNQSKPPKAKNTHPLMFIIIGCVALALVVGLVILIINLINRPSDEPGGDDEPVAEKINTFLLPDDSSNYAVFNEKGEKLTDFVFKPQREVFLNGRTIVKDVESDKVGIINENGEFVVEYGKYNSIDFAGGLYEATDSEKNVYYIDRDGNVAIEANKDTKMLASNTGNSSIAAIAHDDKILIFGVTAEPLVSLDHVKGKDRAVEETCDEYTLILYNGTTYLFNNTEEPKLLTSYKSNNLYEFISTGRDSIRQMVLTPTSNDSGKPAQLLFGDKVVESKVACDSTSTSQDHAECEYFDGRRYWLNEDGELGLRIDDKFIASETAYVQVNVKGELEFYIDGELKNTIESCHAMAYPNIKGHYESDASHYVIMNSCEKDKKAFYEYYALNGEKAFEGEFDLGDKFNKYGTAAVVAGGKSYLINDKGEKVSNDYLLISPLSRDQYIATSLDAKHHYSICAKTSAVINVPEPVKTPDRIELDNGKLLFSVENNGKYTIYDENGEEVFSVETAYVMLTKNYILAMSEDLFDVKFYTHDGKEFHSYSRKVRVEM